MASEHEWPVSSPQHWFYRYMLLTQLLTKSVGVLVNWFCGKMKVAAL